MTEIQQQNQKSIATSGFKKSHLTVEDHTSRLFHIYTNNNNKMLSSSKPSQKSTLGNNNLPLLCHQNESAKIELNELYKPKPKANDRNGQYSGGLAKIKGAANITQPNVKDQLSQKDVELIKKIGAHKGYSSNLQTLIQKNQMKKRLQYEQNEINLKLNTINYDNQRDPAQVQPPTHQRSVSYQDAAAGKKNHKTPYINFVQGQQSNGPSPRNADDIKINKNFNYANTQKQVQRRKRLYDYCLEQQNGGINLSTMDNPEYHTQKEMKSSKLLIEKIRSVKNSLDLLVSEQKSKTKVPLHNNSHNYQSDFTSFLKDQNLDTSIEKIDVNDSFQIQDLQNKYKAYTQSQHDESSRLQKVMSIEQLNSDQKVNIENIKQMAPRDRFQIYSQLQRLSDVKELNAQKLKLADMSLNYAKQLTQLNQQQNQNRSKENKEQLKNQFKELIKKAKDVKKANQLLQSMNTPFKIRKNSQESLLNFVEISKEISFLNNGPISKDRFQALETENQIHIIKGLYDKIYPQQYQAEDDESASEKYTQDFPSRRDSEIFTGPIILTQTEENAIRSRSQKNRMNALTNFTRTPNDFQAENLMIISQIKQDQVLPKLRSHQSTEPQQVRGHKTQKQANENRFSFQNEADYIVQSDSPPGPQTNLHKDDFDEPSFDYNSKLNTLPAEVANQQSEVLDYQAFKEKIQRLKYDAMPSYQRGKRFIRTQVKNAGASLVSQKSGLNIQTQFRNQTVDRSDYTPLRKQIDTHAYATQNFNSNYTMAVDDDHGSDRSEDSATTNRLPHNKHAFTNNVFQQNTPTPLRNRLDRANRVSKIQVLYDQSQNSMPAMNRTISTNKQVINLDRFRDVKKNHLKTDQVQVKYTTMTSAVKSAMKLNMSNNNSMRTTDRVAGGGFGGYNLKGGYGMLAHRSSGITMLAKNSQQQQSFGQVFLNSENVDDMNSSMHNVDQVENNQDYQKLVQGNPIRGVKTLNVKKMNLNRVQPNRYEENRAQFEADLRQNLHRQIEQQREQDRKKQKLRESRRILRASELFGKTKSGAPTGQHSDGEGGFGTDGSQTRSKIHLVTLDGPDPSSNLDGHEDDDKKNAQDEKNRIIDNILEPKKVHKYYPPKKLKNPFEDAMLEQEELLQRRKEAQLKYSEISKNRYKQDQNEPLKYCVRPGNNSNIITRVLEESGRTNAFYDGDENLLFPGWEPADDQHDSLFNFKWKPTSCGIKYDLISKHGLKQLVNHVRNHQELTTKDRLFLNMRQHYESQKLQNVYDVVPLTIVLDYMKDNVSENVQNFLQVHKIIDKVIVKSEKNKTDLVQQVKEINNRIIKYTNQTQKNLKSIMKLTECQHNRQNLWLLKPTGFNRGIGIHIFQSFDELCEIMSNHYGIGRGSRDRVSIFQPHRTNLNTDSANKDKITSTTFVLQKLIERPLLFHQRKFDIRVWVILNTSDGRCHLFKEGYVRTSSKIYKQYDPDISNEEQIYMQLTNNAIQRNGEEYGKYEEGNIISMMQLFEYISGLPQAADKNIEAISVDYQTSMIQIIQNTIKSVKNKLVMQNYTYELLGYDFILDEHLNTQLIEVNTNPCLEESNALLKSLIPRMIDDLLNVVSDPIFNNQNLSGSDAAYKSVYPLPGELFGADHPGYPDTENLFQHICSLQD